jgi:hypothetical protein
MSAFQCIVCDIESVQMRTALCFKCSSEPIGRLLYLFEQMRKFTLGSLPQSADCYQTVLSWFVRNFVYLAAHWPNLEDNDSSSMHSCLLQDHICRECYYLAEEMQKLGGDILRKGVMVEAMSELKDLGLNMTHTTFVFDAITEASGISDRTPSLMYFMPPRTSVQGYHTAVRVYLVIIPLLRTLASIINEYAPLCRCKCSMLNIDRNIMSLVAGCDALACGDHLSCSCCLSSSPQCDTNWPNTCTSNTRCKLCVLKCDDCLQQFCAKNCSRTCSNCGNGVCKNCLNVCSFGGCGAILCEACTKTSFCMNCRDVTCDSCLQTCFQCKSIRTCASCSDSLRCQACDNFLCTNCSKNRKCDNCSCSYCKMDSTNCACCGHVVCTKQTPNACVKTCPFCKETPFCSKCFEGNKCAHCNAYYGCAKCFDSCCSSCGFPREESRKRRRFLGCL